MSEQQSPDRFYLQSSSNETSPLSNEDIIAQKILKRVEIAKMTRQLKEKLYKAGLQVRDQQQQQQQQLNNNVDSPQSSPSKSLSDDVTNNITATAISNIQNSKLVTPTKGNFNFENSNFSISALTPIISPLKRKNSSSIYRSTESNRNFLYENFDDDLISPLKKIHNNSSPYNHSTSPYQFTKGSLLQSPPHSLRNSNSINNLQQPPKTPPQKQIDIFQTNRSNINNIKPLSELKPENHFVSKTELTKSKQRQKITNSKRKMKNSNSSSQQQQQLNDQSNNRLQLNDSNIHQQQLDSLQSNLLLTPKSSNKVKDITITTTPNNKNNHDDLGADLLLFLSNSPARTFNNNNNNSNNSKEAKDFNKVLTIPTTPKSSGSNLPNINLLDSTPMKNQSPHFFMSPNINNTPSNSFLQPLLGTPIGNNISNNINHFSNNTNNNKFANPGTPNNRQSTKNINLNRTPGFSMSDYINFTPSPRVTRTPDFNHSIYSKPMLNNYSKELNLITSIKEDDDN